MIDDPDLAIILVAANRCLNDRLIAAVRGTGARDARPAFGFVIRAVDAEEPTVTRLAELLGVSRQAASKLADEMVQRGYLLRAADPDDRRRTRLRLSAKGRRVRKRAAEESADHRSRVARHRRRPRGRRPAAVPAGLRGGGGRDRGGQGAAVARGAVSSGRCARGVAPLRRSPSRVGAASRRLAPPHPRRAGA